MNKEDYVSFETAKLLKEKGFNEEVKAFYSYDSEFKIYDFQEDDRWDTPNNWGEYYWSAPTLQMAMKWLREVQGISIYIRAVWKDVEIQYGDWESAVVGYEWIVESLLDNTYSKMSVEPFPTYEQACEAAIKYCLENLI